MEEFVINVGRCARCGQDHDDVLFKPLANATDEWSWFATCPATGQPILLSMEDIDEVV